MSRHRPILCSINIPATDFNTSEIQSRIAWHKLDTTVLQRYEAQLNECFSNDHCNNIKECRERIETRHKVLVDNIVVVSESVLPKTCFRRYLKPYWNANLKQLHAVMREKRRHWIADGRPRGQQFQSYIMYKSAKRMFRAQHRLCAEQYLNEVNAEIDQAAEMNSSFFWRKVNSRRKQSHSNAGSEIRFGDNVCRDPEQIASEWGGYFRKLYEESESPDFDSDFKSSIDSQVHDITSEFPSSCIDDSTGITFDDVCTAVKSLKTKKACGPDAISNEHLINGGIELWKQLSLLFTDMYNMGYVPANLKKGIIITLHKGGRKSKSDPNNYRAITLSSCILKLFERILLQRAEAALNVPISPLQGGFRAGLGCNMSSLMLRECISFTKENHSKLFVCFLDVQKAFDCVWHNGLFVKLYNMGIRSNLLRVIIDLHKDMKSAVFYKGYHSPWFSVMQGTRQGGVLSPFLYLCFNNDLINELVASKFGFKLNTRVTCAPTVADDMLLMALSKLGLDALMRICFSNGCKWRFLYGPLKCNVVVYNETKNNFQKSNRQWFLGHHPIQESESYTYLGTIFNKYLSLKDNIKDACDKLKGTFVSLVHGGIIQEQGLHTLSCLKIYRCIVLPKALYGCENWNNLSNTDIMCLERAHRYCIKYMQGLHRRTRTDISLSLVGSHSLEAEIDSRKLQLFGQFCRLRINHWLRHVFINRLTAFFVNGASQTGFIPDVVRLLEKYNLSCVLDAYLRDSAFPSKFTWKRMVKYEIHSRELYQWHTRTSQPEFARFHRIVPTFGVHDFWTLSKTCPKFTDACKSVIQMIGSILDCDVQLCHKCNCFYNNIVDHCISECACLHNERVKMWDRFYAFNPQVYMYLRSLDKISLTSFLLGEVRPDFTLDINMSEFWSVAFLHLRSIWLKFNL